MQSEAGKLLYSKTALKRCTSTEHLWKRKLASLTSPEHWEIFLPKRANVLYTPKVSIAMGSSKYRLSMLEYLSSLSLLLLLLLFQEEHLGILEQDFYRLDALPVT